MFMDLNQEVLSAYGPYHEELFEKAEDKQVRIVPTGSPSVARAHLGYPWVPLIGRPVVRLLRVGLISSTAYDAIMCHFPKPRATEIGTFGVQSILMAAADEHDAALLRYFQPMEAMEYLRGLVLTPPTLLTLPSFCTVIVRCSLTLSRLDSGTRKSARSSSHRSARHVDSGEPTSVPFIHSANLTVG